ncbi:MAG TPA: PAS domain S-box protein, partial [Phycisphaerales bacterium]|nr:PAS domain S-box protein [Phycisphaerales bacterium]
GYLYGVDTLFALPRVTAIALSTAVALSALGVGVFLAADAEVGAATKALSHEPSERLLLRAGLPLAVAVPVLLGWLRVAGERAGLFDSAYGTALRTVLEVLVLTSIARLAAAAVGRRERALRQTKEELARRSDQLAAFLDTAAVGLHRVGPDGIILWANDAELQMLGYSREEYVGRHIAEFHADPEAIADIMARLGRHERLRGYEARLRRRDGEIRQVLIDSSVYCEDGRFIHTQCFTRDITAERAAEAALRASERRARQIIDAVPAAVYTTDAQGRVTSFNPAAVVFSGRTPELGTDRWCVTWRLYYPDGTRMPHDQCPMAMALRGEPVPAGVEAMAERPDGSRLWFQPFPTVLRDAEGRVTGAVNMLVDITARKQEEAAAARLAAIVESSDDAIVSKDLNGIVRTWNAGAERTFGYTALEMVGRPISTLLPSDRSDEGAEILRRLKRGERVDHFETVRKTKDGRLIDVAVTVSPVRDATGRIVGASKVARDVTERRSAQRERETLLAAERAARAEAERLGRMKDEFLATLSHELRTPLSAVLGWTSIMRRPGCDAATIQSGLEVIDRNARVQTRLVEDLLDMSRVMAGKLQIRPQAVDVPALVRAAVESVQAAATAKGVAVRCDLACGAAHVWGDPTRLQQVVWNLLSNAVKFTPSGGVVAVGVSRQGKQLEIGVADTGEGIAPEFLPAVFDRFRQADASTTRRHGGLGLGLAIVKQLVEAHGGSVRAESPGQGRGAVFTVTLPAHLPPGADAAQPAGVPSELDRGRPLAGLCVLVVDDDGDATDLVRRVLSETGATVHIAPGGEEALDMVPAVHPDVIVSDLSMPGMDGFTLLRLVRSLSPGTGDGIPVVAHSALARPEDREQALAAGFCAFVAKPIEPAELVAAVAACGVNGRRTQLQTVALRSGPSGSGVFTGVAAAG